MSKSTIIIEKSVNDAIFNAMLAVEAGRFKKVITLLEYVQSTNVKYDLVMVNYALLISYMNTGDLVSAAKLVDRFKNININNEEISNVINAIEKDLDSQTQIVPKVQTNPKPQLKTKIIGELNFDDVEYIYSHGSFGHFGLLKEKGFHNDIIEEAYNLFEAFEENIINFSGFRDDFSPRDMMYLLDAMENAYCFWYLEYITHDSERYEFLITDSILPTFVKSYILERYTYLAKLNIFEHKVFVFEGTNVDTKLTPSVLSDITTYINEIETTLQMTELFEDDDYLDHMIANLLRIFLIDGYPFNQTYRVSEIIHIISFIMFKVNFGEKAEEIFENYFDFELNLYQKEINKIMLLLTFL